jgi:hemerythrin-like domain-containing protein/quercetin dioxygenase-like cupin family protein
LDTLQQALSEIYHRQCAQALETAKKTLDQLTLELNTHFACEEQALFPTLSKYHPMMLMEAEHDEILSLRLGLEEALATYTFSEDCTKVLYQLGNNFSEALRNHIAREDNGIFPMAEKELSAFEKEQIWTDMKTIRDRAENIPTPEVVRPELNFQSFTMKPVQPLSKDIDVQLLLEKENLQIKVLEIKAGSAMLTHWSPKQIILILCSGEAQWNASGTSLPLKLGDGLLVDPRLSHSLEAHSDCRF